MNFHEKLLKLRKESGLSQEQLAEKLDISRQAVSKWETGESQPDLSKLISLGDIFSVSIDELCGKKSPVYDREPAAKRAKSSNMILAIVLIVSLTIGFLGGFLIHTAPDNKPVFDDFKITSFNFYTGTANSSSRTLLLVFSPSISNKDLQYSVVKTDSNGNTRTYDAQSDNGVCK